jgi:5S rRNA maturation endonuclease (ribonuclease M5)
MTTPTVTTAAMGVQNPTFHHGGKLENLADGQVRRVPLSQINPSPENDELYISASPKERENQKLAADIRAEGVKNPLILTLDFYILSGHRRYHCAQRAGLQDVPCLFENIRRPELSKDAYIALLRSHNFQRQKTTLEQMREEIVDADKTTARRKLIEAREEKARELDSVDFVDIEGEVKRSKITSVKEEMVSAILAAVEERKAFWPLSVRSIHYALLNAPPLRNCGTNPKFRKLYANDRDSYGDLCDLCARLRLIGRLSWNAISDETRPFDLATLDNSPKTYFEREFHWFLRGFRRNLLQSQPHHIEIVGEKNTVRSTLKPIADKYGVPLTTARGFSSMTPRLDVSTRYKQSGKDKLIILALTDFDPCGEEIAHGFARSLRDDFGVKRERIELLKVALNQEQVERFSLVPDATAKISDKKSTKFTEKHGAFVWELEALPLPILQSELQSAIDSVLDVRAFNQELESEAENAVEIDTRRRMVLATVQQSDTF